MSNRDWMQPGALARIVKVDDEDDQHLVGQVITLSSTPYLMVDIHGKWVLGVEFEEAKDFEKDAGLPPEIHYFMDVNHIVRIGTPPDWKELSTPTELILPPELETV